MLFNIFSKIYILFYRFLKGDGKMDLKEKRATLFEDENCKKTPKIKLKEKTNLIIGDSVIEISDIPP